MKRGRHVRRAFLRVAATMLVAASILATGRAEQIPVRHVEGGALGFLVLRTLDGTVVAYGDSKQVAEKNRLRLDLTFHFRDGSSFEEDTYYTQDGKFRVLADHVAQRGPSFHQTMEAWIDAVTGDVKVIYQEKGKEKEVNKRLEVPPDVCNGILFILLKNVDPGAAQTTVSMVVASSSPRVVKLQITPQAESTAAVGYLTYKTQTYRIHVAIGGVAGKVAPLIGKQPPDLQAWLIKSEAPTFLEFEGPLESQGAVWRMDLAAPAANRGSPATK